MTSYGIPRVVAFDLDGTLAESKQPMTLEMGELLAKLLSRVPVAVMSGAGFPQFKHQFLSGMPAHARLERLHLFPTSAAAHYVYRANQWHPEYDHSFSKEEKEKVLQALKEVTLETGITCPPEHQWGECTEDRGAEITFSGLGQQAPIVEKEHWDPTGEKRHQLQETLAKRLPEFSVRTGGMTSVDITRENINKAYGVQSLAKAYGCLTSEMLYVGDALEPGGNDEVVIKTGIQTAPVFGPKETAAVIEELLKTI